MPTPDSAITACRWPMNVSEYLMYLVAEKREGDASTMRLTEGKRLGEVLRLIQRDPRGHRRLERIDNGLDDRRSLLFEGRLERVAHFFGLLAAKSNAATGLGKFHEVDRLQLDTICGIAEKYHLLPLDHPEYVVLDDHDRDRQLVFHRGGEFAHQHREATVANERDTLSVGIRNLRGDCVGKTWRHCREITGKREELPTTDLDMTRDPRRNGPAVRGDDGIIGKKLAQLMRDHLRLYRCIFARFAFPHEATPLLHSLLAIAQKSAISTPYDQRQQGLKRRLGVAGQANVDWIP